MGLDISKANQIMTKCVFCKHGLLKPGKANFMGERDDLLVVIRNVPALVCDNCEEEYFDESVTDNLLTEVDKFASSGEKVLIRDYAAA